jgi:uncharacterized membrane protein
VRGNGAANRRSLWDKRISSGGDIAVGGTDLGFWFAQQGSILVFLGLIFFYAWRMNKLDREHGVEEE